MEIIKRYWPLALIVTGILVILAGFLYDVLFAGIPYQDPTPALAARYTLHARIAGIIRRSGVITALIGGLVLAVLEITRKLQSQYK